MLRTSLACLSVLVLSSVPLLGCGGGGGAPVANTVTVVPPNDGPPVGPPVEPAPVPPVPNPNDPPPPVEDVPVDPPADPPVVAPPTEPPVAPPVIPPLPVTFLGFGAALDVAYDPAADNVYAIDSARAALIVREGVAGAERVVAPWILGRVVALTWKAAAGRLAALVQLPRVGDPTLSLVLMEIAPWTGEVLAYPFRVG